MAPKPKKHTAWVAVSEEEWKTLVRAAGIADSAQNTRDKTRGVAGFLRRVGLREAAKLLKP